MAIRFTLKSEDLNASKRMQNLHAKWNKFPLGLLAITVITSLLYFNTYKNPFQYDDEKKILENSFLRIATPGLILSLIRPGVYSEEITRLIPNLSLVLNYKISGKNPISYNITNVFIHLSNRILIFYFCRKVISKLGRTSEAFPILAALLFSIHPLNSECVNYINARPNLALTFFIF